LQSLVGSAVAQSVQTLTSEVEDRDSVLSRGNDMIFFFFSPQRPGRLWDPPRALSPGVKLLGREADHSPPSCGKVKNAWSYTSTPPIRIHEVVLS
jgi:hypothetical protein